MPPKKNTTPKQTTAPKKTKAEAEPVAAEEPESPKKSNIPRFKFDGDVDDVEAQLTEMKARMTNMQKEFNHELTIYRHFVDDLGRNYMRLKKEQDKVLAKKASRKGGDRILPQSKISDELADFLGKDHGTMLSRPEALGFIATYAKENDLAGKEVTDDDGNSKIDKRIIQLDGKLKKLFPNLAKSGEDLRFNTILKHIGPHFEKKEG
jgi:chromatin remodeling complex protein RSC6